MNRTRWFRTTIIIAIIAAVLAACSLSGAKSSLGNADNTDIPQFSIADVPEYSGNPSVVINDGTPFFEIEDYETNEGFQYYGELDDLGRCTSCVALITPDMMPGEDEVRGDISDIHPTGWMSDQGWERCHLIAWCLTGQNDNILNLITGTHYFNTEGMLPYEVEIANYIRNTGNPVLYRVTPIYDGDNMIASGVLMEAESVADSGDSICYDVFCYNVYPNENTIIDYMTGEVTQAEASDDAERPVKYILNVSSRKIHYPECKSVSDMAEHNKKAVYDETVEELEAQGYSPCGNCHPEG